MSSIALVKPQKAAMVENVLIQMARTGQIGGKVCPFIELVELYIALS